MGIEKYIGTRYSKLVVIDVKRENRDTYCLCECDCKGEESIKWIRRESLKQGLTTSCGCVNKKNIFKAKELTGMTFHLLKVIEKTDIRRHGAVVWKCQCKCGNIAYIEGRLLLNESTKSCGCLQKTLATEHLKKMFPSYLENNYIDGTNLDRIKNNTPLNNNSSGYLGVHFDKERNKYIARIEFKKKKYYLGRFDTAEEASSIYQLAKIELHGNFIEWYETEFKPNHNPRGAAYKKKISDYSLSNPKYTITAIAEHFKCTKQYISKSLNDTNTYTSYNELHELAKNKSSTD